jgi:pilus assembly protein Flp/PilA
MHKFFASLTSRLFELRDREEGQAMAEYGIILSLIAVACIAAVYALGGHLNGVFEFIVTKF